MNRPVVWIHGEALGPDNPALVAHPGRPAVFVFDTDLIERQGISLKRLGFLYECLLALPVTLRRGDVAAEVLAFATRHQADAVITTAAVDPRFAPIHHAIACVLPVAVLPVPPLVELPAPGRGTTEDLRRFSRYWKRAEPLIWQGWNEPGHDPITRRG
ncbi:MAG: deoxyribodipyrimidine photo-lyase [Cyanobacteria bacterium K_DeepCast_35m_m2_023]|nr:deoxyribodipyrimidine photo-lyase [Cyanobacteria bacterium K_DeepCast_35m_m2_023]